MKTKNKKIKLRPFKLSFAPNGYAYGLVLKRELTFREANYIANKIFGIVTELSLECFDDKDEFSERKIELVNDMQNLIKGEVGYDHICNEWACGEGLDDLNPAIFFNMLKYLLEKDLIQ